MMRNGQRPQNLSQCRDLGMRGKPKRFFVFDSIRLEIMQFVSRFFLFLCLLFITVRSDEEQNEYAETPTARLVVYKVNLLIEISTSCDSHSYVLLIIFSIPIQILL
jgi:hypothetical protein